MTVFVLMCVLMVLLAVVLLAKPLLRAAAVPVERNQNRAVLVLFTLLIAVLSAGLYLKGSNWSWSAATDTPSAGSADAQLDALASQAQAQPDNLALQLQLASAHVTASNFAKGAEVYQRAYELSNGQNLDAITGWAEALVLTDPNAVNGRASLLIEEALKLDPQHPRALWYGGLIALQMQNLPLARDRFQTMLALNPPEAVRKLLERQVQDLNDQLGEGSAAVAQAEPAPVDPAGRKITVQVQLSAALKAQLKQPVSLFVLARDPKQPGAPLAVERHTSDELPLTVELSVADAMLPTRTLNDAESVEVVARLSASGTPTAQSGDLFGSASYSFATQGAQGAVSIEINQKTP